MMSFLVAGVNVVVVVLLLLSMLLIFWFVFDFKRFHVVIWKEHPNI